MGFRGLAKVQGPLGSPIVIIVGSDDIQSVLTLGTFPVWFSFGVTRSLKECSL
jgi:hypothetical protein